MNRCGLFLINLGVKGSVPPQETWLFLLSFKLGNSIPSTQTETKLLYKYKHIFFLKTGSLILNWVPLFLLQSIIPERLSSQSILPNYLVNWEYLEVQPRLMLKTTTTITTTKNNFSSLFLNWEKLRSPGRATFKNYKISLWIKKDLEVWPKINSRKSQFWI